MKKMICIVCPRGCELSIDELGNITGNKCVRGPIYAKEEITCPRRILTSSIRVINRKDLLCSIKTTSAIKKEDIFEFMKIINRLTISAPCPIGTIVCRNVLNSGIDIITTKDVK